MLQPAKAEHQQDPTHEHVGPHDWFIVAPPWATWDFSELKLYNDSRPNLSFFDFLIASPCEVTTPGIESRLTTSTPHRRARTLN